MNSNLKHTPGPWFAVEYAGRYSFQRKDEYGGPDLLDQDSCSRACYNAKLAAAAPELLKELMYLVRLLEPLEREGSLDVPGLVTLNGARNAIKKAIE
jgi:hypothetical protein